MSNMRVCTSEPSGFSRAMYALVSPLSLVEPVTHSRPPQASRPPGVVSGWPTRDLHGPAAEADVGLARPR